MKRWDTDKTGLNIWDEQRTKGEYKGGVPEDAGETGTSVNEEEKEN